MREEILNEGNLRIYLVETDNDELVVELESAQKDPDLSIEDEVIVVVNGENREVTIGSADAARAVLGTASKLATQPFELMIRVHEVFEGWDFDSDND